MSLHLPHGWTVSAFDAVGSTNDEAARLAEAGAAEGTVVWAREQTGGRGRRGRTWSSPPGNLYSSTVLRPDVRADFAGQLSLLVALAVADWLAPLLHAEAKLRLKWPNDVLVNEAKIAGILLESSLRPDGGVQHVIVGTGVNVGWRPPPEATPYPTVKLAEVGAAPALEEALAGYLTALAARLAQWRNEGFGPIRDAWLARADFGGRRVTARMGDEIVTGRPVGIDARGAIEIETAPGVRRVVGSGEVIG